MGRPGTSRRRQPWPASAAPRVDSWPRRRREARADLRRLRVPHSALRIHEAPPRQARQGRHAATLRAPGHHHARDGVRRHPRKPRPRGHRFTPHAPRPTFPRRPVLRRGDSRPHHPRIRPRRDRARPSHHPREHQPPGERADDHRPQLPREDQRQHRQLRRVLVDRGGGGQAALGDALGRRYGHGPVHGRRHPRDARVDPAQRARADRHRADLSGAREGQRAARGADLGDLPRTTSPSTPACCCATCRSPPSA